MAEAVRKPFMPPSGQEIAERSRKSLARALVASSRAAFESDRNPHRIIARDYWHDHIATLVLKGASAPHSTADTALLQTVVEAAVLGATGAGVQLLRRGLVLLFGRNAVISLPTLVCDASHGSFVGEGQPIPVHALSIGAPVTMEPRKLAAITVLTREMLGGPNVEALVEEAMRRSVGLALDARLFGSDAADDIAPAGLRNGVVALTASADTDAYNAMLADIGALLAAVGPVGSDVVLVANTVRAKMMPAMARGGVLPVVLGSPSVAAADLIAISVDGLAAALGGEIEVLASKGATLHMDTAPLAIGAVGTPAVVAAPTRSVFQTDSVAMRLRLPVTWALRDPRSIAWVTTSW